MPTPAPGQPRFLRKLATFALTLACLFLAASNASAQISGRLQRYSERWYGQNFYDHQHSGFLFGPHGGNRQHYAGFYGPPEMYSRQYVDQFGYARPNRFAPFPTVTEAGYGYGPYNAGAN